MGVDLECSAQMSHTLLHPEQSQASFGFGPESAAVILDHDMDRVRTVLDRDSDGARAGMPGAIVQRLLNNPVDARFMLFGKIVRDTTRSYVDANTRAPGHLARLPFERGDQA